VAVEARFGSCNQQRKNRWLVRKAMTAGASGGKICGAGGGGFLLIVAKPECQQAVRHALQDLKEVPLSYETRGSQVMLPFIG